MSEPDCFSDIVYALQHGILLRRENPTYRYWAIWAAATRGFKMVSFTASRRNNFVGGTCALSSALLVGLLVWFVNRCATLILREEMNLNYIHKYHHTVDANKHYFSNRVVSGTTATAALPLPLYHVVYSHGTYGTSCTRYVVWYLVRGTWDVADVVWHAWYVKHGMLRAMVCLALVYWHLAHGTWK